MRTILTWAALLGASGLASAALAQSGSDPRCAKMGDKVSCACALENGGNIRPDGRGWVPGRGPANREAFSACIAKRKG